MGPQTITCQTLQTGDVLDFGAICCELGHASKLIEDEGTSSRRDVSGIAGTMDRLDDPSTSKALEPTDSSRRS